MALAKDRTVATIVLYANGFKVGEEGEFRDASEPANQQFIDTLKRG